MPFGNLLDPNTYSRRDNRTLQDLLAKRIEQQIDVADANAQTRAADQAAELAGRTMGDRVSTASSQAKGLEYGLPVLQQQGREAEIGMGFLDQMFPKAQPQVPPHLAAFGPQPEPQAPMGNAFADKSLADLRALKANAGPVGQFLGGYVDPIIAQKSLAEEMTPALQEIATIAKMPGGTKEQLRDKSAALSAIAAKYPGIVDSPKFKEAIDIANPKNSDVVYHGDAVKTTGQVISLENQLRDEYEKIATDSRTIARAGQDIAAALKTNNSLSIRTAVTKFSKIADPTTGVLGGEASATEKAAMGDLINTMEGSLQRMVTGGMTPESKKNFESATRDLLRVQQEIFRNAQARASNRFKSYQQRFPNLNISLDAVMGSEGDRAKELDAFNAFPEASAAGGLTPEKARRLAELRAKKAAGTLK
jgi:hypothetical protein